ncbi:HupE/UreJ family protein [Sphingobium sp. HWE2-09]|uniref:HupE/UreJ family protein n=1 Tax=Sphingobium sp. HWE2-09 TaxID=3108390 RepID=UPI002DCBEB2B|nr:HupE/UreJ family protein [Sphingobium sp. HWE2-09]
MTTIRTGRWLCATLALCQIGVALAHDVAQGDRGYIATTTGVQLGTFFYLGAKHMVTGTDHLLFLIGVIFFLHGLRQIATYVTLFAIGHSTTLILGVLLGTNVSPYLVDAIIALSVVYKAMDNIGAFRRWFGCQPDTRSAVLIFGFFHGLGLATKLQDLGLSSDGLVPNLIAFNLGVEAGQLLALALILIAMGYWRRTASFATHAFAANVVLMTAGFILFVQQMTGYVVGAST